MEFSQTGHSSAILSQAQQEPSPSRKIQDSNILIRQNISPESSSFLQKSQQSIRNSNNAHNEQRHIQLSESIKNGERNDKDRYFQQTLRLREKLIILQDQLHSANTKGALWDKLKNTISGFQKEKLIQLKSIEVDGSDGIFLKELTAFLRDSLQNVRKESQVEKYKASQNQSRISEFEQLYEAQKKRRFQYQQHIMNLNNQLDVLQEQNEKLKVKLKLKHKSTLDDEFYQPSNKRKRKLSASSESNSQNKSGQSPISKPTQLAHSTKSPLHSVSLVQTRELGGNTQELREQIQELKERNNHFQEQHQIMLLQIDEEKQKVRQAQQALIAYVKEKEQQEENRKVAEKFLERAQRNKESPISNHARIQQSQKIQLNRIIEQQREFKQTFKNQLSEQIKENDILRTQKQALLRRIESLQPSQNTLQDPTTSIELRIRQSAIKTHTNSNKADGNCSISQQYQIKLREMKEQYQINLKERQMCIQQKEQEIEDLQRKVLAFQKQFTANFEETDINQQNCTMEQLKKAFNAQKQKSSILHRNISEWQFKYYELKTIFEKQKAKTQYLERFNHPGVIKESDNEDGSNMSDSSGDKYPSQYSQGSENFKQQQQQQTIINTLTNNLQNEHQYASVEKMKALQAEIEFLNQENKNYRSSIQSVEIQVKQIVLNFEQIKEQNKRIPELQEKNKNLKQQINDQKRKFIEILEKNQSVYNELTKKNEQNQRIMKNNIIFQKDQAERLEQMLDLYYQKTGKKEKPRNKQESKRFNMTTNFNSDYQSMENR